jgi:PadR family transcriptional regulator, regulatory protein PadR
MLLLDTLGELLYSSPKVHRKDKKSAELLQGTLDLLVLKAVSLGKMHGYGILLRIEQISEGSLAIEQGALYPALYRLERQGLLDTEWGTSENNRRAKYYMLTSRGRVQLKDEERSWSRLVEAIATALKARPREV